MTTIRYVTTTPASGGNAPNTTPSDAESQERFRLMRLCPCDDCGATGKALDGKRCKTCRGERRELQEVATCGTPEAVGLAIVTLAREGEWDDCPFGLIDRLGEKGKRWLLLPFQASPRNVSDAGRLLRAQR
jgi:hypothetical protein